MWSDHNFYSSHNVVQCDDDSISYQILASKSLLPKSMSREPIHCVRCKRKVNIDCWPG